MIQRIQSVFLFLAALANGGQFILPYATSNDGTALGVSIPSLSDGVLNPFDNPGLVGLSVLSVVMALAAIFMYRNRMQQARVAGLAALVTLFLVFLIGFVVYNITSQIPTNTSIHYREGLFLPLAALILIWLSVRYIRKDEALVRSMNRLR